MRRTTDHANFGELRSSTGDEDKRKKNASIDEIARLTCEVALEVIRRFSQERNSIG